MERLFKKFQALGLAQAEKYQGKITTLGAGCRIISDGGNNSNLERVFTTSLLGLRIPNIKLDSTEFTSREKDLLSRPNCRILTIVDFDGVLVSPLHALVNIKDNSKVGFQNLRWLARTAKASDLTIIWTSRLYLPEFLLEKSRILRRFTRPFRDRIAYFPLIDQTSITNLERLGKDKLAVEYDKLLTNPGIKLKEFIDKAQPDIVYYIGSSIKDRKLILNFLENNPHHAHRTVFIDTCHLIL
jgi:hypothetical protein